jgi:hypothetical protein
VFFLLEHNDPCYYILFYILSFLSSSCIVLAYGKDAVVLKAVDIAVNSLYINLVPEYNKRRELIKKGTYFLDLTKEFSSESAWKLLQVRNQECIKTLL